jgi:hypothetical protein
VNDEMQVTGVQWAPGLAGLVFVALGVAAYAGVAKPFIRTLWPRPTLAFGLLWLGLGGALVGFGWPALANAWGVLAVGLPALACWVIGLLSFGWMPQALQPRWFREWTDWEKGLQR